MESDWSAMPAAVLDATCVACDLVQAGLDEQIDVACERVEGDGHVAVGDAVDDELPASRPRLVNW